MSGNDQIIHNIDNEIIMMIFDPDTETVPFQKTKMDYLLTKIFALAFSLTDDEEWKADALSSFIKVRYTPGSICKVLEKLELNQDLFDLMCSYRDERNLKWGHGIIDPVLYRNFLDFSDMCFREIVSLDSDTDNEFNRYILKGVTGDDPFYYIIKKNEHDCIVSILYPNGGNEFKRIPNIQILSNAIHLDEFREDDLLMMVDYKFIKISPFISYDYTKGKFKTVVGIGSNQVFEESYLLREEVDHDRLKRNPYPYDLFKYLPDKEKNLSLPPFEMNEFSQKELFEQDYYEDVHQDILDELDRFLSGNMASGAVRGIGGVGKTATVFMWIKRLLKDRKRLDTIREKFNLQKLIFLSAKTTIYTRQPDSTTYQYFVNVSSDIATYGDIIRSAYQFIYPQDENVNFEIMEERIRNYDHENGVLIIIDDYESLAKKARDQVDRLKEDLQASHIKLLITTRFAATESRSIIVTTLNQEDNEKMTDYIFNTHDWVNTMSPKMMYTLTSGLPILIWYAKAFYNIGMLSEELVSAGFVGSGSGLDDYLYRNFKRCFNEAFSKNFLMITKKFYQHHKSLSMPKTIATFLCLEDVSQYDQTHEEFYFEELHSLKLLTLDDYTVDFSPLLTYINKSTTEIKASELYQKDALELIIHLDPREYRAIPAVINACHHINEETRRRILERLIAFAQDESDPSRILALRKLFDLEEDKWTFYQENKRAFQIDETLSEVFVNFLYEIDFSDHEFDLYQDVYKYLLASKNTKMKMETVEKVICILINMYTYCNDEKVDYGWDNHLYETEILKLRNLSIHYLDLYKDQSSYKDYLDEINELLRSGQIFSNQIKEI